MKDGRRAERGDSLSGVLEAASQIRQERDHHELQPGERRRGRSDNDVEVLPGDERRYRSVIHDSGYHFVTNLPVPAAATIVSYRQDALPVGCNV